MSHRLRGAFRRRGVQAAVGSLAVSGALAAVGAADAADDATIIGAASTWEPPTATIETGESVTWTWDGPETHNLVGTSGPPADPNWPGERVGFEQEAQYTRQFTQPGNYSFVCQVHAGTMTGTITVTGDPVEPTPTSSPGEPTPTATSTPPAGTPTPVPTTGPGGAPADDHTSTPAPTGSAAADRSAPAISELALKRIKRGARVAFVLSEPASVTLTARKGERTLRTLRLQVRSGEHTVKVRRIGKGRRTFALQARDAAGNRSDTVSASIRVRRK